MTRRVRTSGRSKLRFEPLEGRMMLNGTVLVQLLPAGRLAITGDRFANSVSVTESAGVFTITGNMTADGMDTFIRAGLRVVQVSPTSVQVQNVRKDVDIDLRGGDDILIVGELPPAPPVTAVTNIPKDLNINMGDGQNQVAVVATNVGNDLRIASGPCVDAVAVALTSVRRDVCINTGLGDDLVALAFSRAGHSIGAQTMAGADMVLATEVTGLAGLNEVLPAVPWSKTAAEVEQFKLDTGLGNEFVQVSLDEAGLAAAFDQFVADHGLPISLPGLETALNDLLAAIPPDSQVSLAARCATIGTDAGCDTVSLDSMNVTRDLTVRLGAGNDLLAFYNSNVFGCATLDGGAGFRDVLYSETTYAGNQLFGKPRIVDFERFPATLP